MFQIGWSYDGQKGRTSFPLRSAAARSTSSATRWKPLLLSNWYSSSRSRVIWAVCPSSYGNGFPVVGPSRVGNHSLRISC
jgi:hypothetical protein